MVRPFRACLEQERRGLARTSGWEERMLRQMERSAVHVLAKRGKSIRRIAAELGRSPTTIARVLHESRR
jgi:IS30 family transposase